MQTPQFRFNFVSLSFFLGVFSFLSCLLSLSSTHENSASRMHHFRWDSIREYVNAVVWSQILYFHVCRALVCSHAPLSPAGWVRAIDWTQCHFPYTLCATICFFLINSCSRRNVARIIFIWIFVLLTFVSPIRCARLCAATCEWALRAICWYMYYHRYCYYCYRACICAAERCELPQT